MSWEKLLKFIPSEMFRMFSESSNKSIELCSFWSRRYCLKNRRLTNPSWWWRCSRSWWTYFLTTMVIWFIFWSESSLTRSDKRKNYVWKGFKTCLVLLPDNWLKIWSVICIQSSEKLTIIYCFWEFKPTTVPFCRPLNYELNSLDSISSIFLTS